MKKEIIYIALAIFGSGCASNEVVRDVRQSSDSSNAIAVHLHEAGYKSENELAKYRRAVRLAENALNSESFKVKVLAGPEHLRYIDPDSPEPETKECDGGSEATYTFNVVGGECMSNRAILELIESSDWGISARINYRWWAIWCGKPFIYEVGHREGKTIVTQQCHFDQMSDEQLAGHLIHEHLHVLGFDHPYKKSVNRQYTVPYFVGDVATELLGN